jgi:L-asparaginase
VAGARLPKVVVLTTGGTIVTRVGPDRKSLPPLSGEALIQAVPWIKTIADLEVQAVADVGSSDMTPEIWLQLLDATNKALADPNVAGVVVTHGTDTLEETAYFLDVTVTSTKPVILVGAQRMASDPFPDGPRNLLDAVKVAISPAAVDRGVMVVMNGQINSAKDVTKTNTLTVGTFRSLEYGELGIVSGDTVSFARFPEKRVDIPLDPGTRLPRVEIVMHYAGADGTLVRDLMRGSLFGSKVDGLVIAAAGLGHVSSAMFDQIKVAREKGIPVVIATRVYTGPTLPVYPGKGLGKSLQDIGCIFVKNDLTPQKARILLMLAMTKTKDPAALQKYFER